MVREELEGDDLQDGEEEFVALGDGDDVLDELVDVLVAFDGDGDYAAGAGRDFLDVGEGFFVLQDR